MYGFQCESQITNSWKGFIFGYNLTTWIRLYSLAVHSFCQLVYHDVVQKKSISTGGKEKLKTLSRWICYAFITNLHFMITTHNTLQVSKKVSWLASLWRALFYTCACKWGSLHANKLWNKGNAYERIRFKPRVHYCRW